MSDKQSSNKQQDNNRPKPAPKSAALEQSPAEAMVGKLGQERNGAPADLPKNGNSRALRQAQMVQLQRQHGNGYVQRFLAQRANGGHESGSSGGKSSVKVTANRAPTPMKDRGTEPHLASDILGQDLGRTGPATMAPLEPPPPPQDDEAENQKPTSDVLVFPETEVTPPESLPPEEEVNQGERYAEELDEADVGIEAGDVGVEAGLSGTGALLQRDNESEGQQPSEGAPEQAPPAESPTPEGGAPEGETPGASTEGETTPGQTTEGGEAEQPAEGGATPEGEGGGEGGSSRGAGGIEGAREDPYDVTGATLDAISGQLNQVEGYGAGSSTPLGIEGEIMPERLDNGSYRVTVPWTINDPVVMLPRWLERDQACEAAQNEWDRFLRQTRIHEQTAHIDGANNILENLPESDRVITAPSRQLLVQRLQAKQQQIAQRIQTHHDGCDHGVSIDAILHPDNGRCESEE